MRKWYQKSMAVLTAAACLFAGGNDWSCSGFSATTATDGRGGGQNLHRGCLWVAVGVRRVGRWNGRDYKVRKFLFDRHRAAICD